MSVVGNYTMTYLTPRTPPARDSGGWETFVDNFAGPPVRLTMEQDGTFIAPDYLLDGSRRSGTWKVSNGTVTLRFIFPASGHTPSSYVQTARQLGSNLGSSSSPGVVVLNGKRVDRWYAVRNHGRLSYDAAKAQWMGDALVVGTGGQDPPLQLAITDLKNGEVSDAGNTSGYGAAITAIKAFESMPITDVTPGISEQENAVVATINRFFGLPPTPWPGECDSSGPGKRAAATAWATEPVQSLTGVVALPLAKAVTDLRHGLTADRGDTSCYAAAIADLQSLKSAKRADLSKDIPYGDEIGYLNQFFNGRQYVLGGADNPVVP